MSTAVSVIAQGSDDPLANASPEELEACARLLAASVAHHRAKFGVVPIASSSDYLQDMGRSTQDAIGGCFNALSRRWSAEWILEGDIRGCFDHLDHDWLVDRLPTDKGRLRAWLKAGFLERDVFHPTAEGTPQGGIVSPTAANMALDGLERRLHTHFKSYHKVHLVRYADGTPVQA